MFAGRRALIGRHPGPRICHGVVVRVGLKMQQPLPPRQGRTEEPTYALAVRNTAPIRPSLAPPYAML